MGNTQLCGGKGSESDRVDTGEWNLDGGKMKGDSVSRKTAPLSEVQYKPSTFRRSLTANNDLYAVKMMNPISKRIHASLKKIEPFKRDPKYDQLYKKIEGTVHGTFRSKNTGNTYKGDIKNGSPFGIGTFIANEGEYIEGYFWEGYPAFKYIKVEEDGTAYVGEWNDKGMRHGIGTLLSTDGTITKGEWADDKVNGKCEIFDSNGDILFQGKMIKNRKEGYCLFKDPAKELEYIGDFRDGLFYGEGVLITPEGKYEGTFELGKKEGIGVFIARDGEITSGYWFNDNCTKQVQSPRFSQYSRHESQYK